MKEIAYPNFSRPNRWLGVFEYQTALFLLIYMLIIFCISRLLCSQVIFQIYSVCIFTIPVVCVCIANTNQENLLNIILICIKYILSVKSFVYYISSKNSFEYTIDEAVMDKKINLYLRLKNDIIR